MTDKKPIVVGTIGHMDHGKTALTAALQKVAIISTSGMDNPLDRDQQDRRFAIIEDTPDGRALVNAARQAQIKQEYGEDAKMAPAPYKPNRKQRRAQKARKRSK